MAPEEFLRHAPFLRRLAREVLGDAHLADDAVQETWLAARRSPPREDRNVRGWLARVVQNVARKFVRGEVRRAQRERDHAPAPPTTPDDARQRERVARALRRLPEPYRTALVLRYYDDLPPREIAARLDTPVETVRTRLRRGLDRLRALMERPAPLLWLPWPGLAAAVAGIAVLGLLVPGSPVPARTAGEREDAQAVRFVEKAFRSGADGRRFLLHGVLEGRPHDGLVRAGPLKTRADADGRFVFDITELAGALEVSYDHADAVPVAQRWWPGDGRVALRVRAASRVGGQVVGADGTPRAGILVGVFPVEAERPAPLPSDCMRTGADGGFDLRAPRGYDRVLVALGPERAFAAVYDTGARFHSLRLRPAGVDRPGEGAPMALGPFRLQWFGRRVELVDHRDEQTAPQPAPRCGLRVVARGGHGQPLDAVVLREGRAISFSRGGVLRPRLFAVGRAWAEPLPPGWHVLELRHPGYRPLRVSARAPGVLDVTLEASR